MGSMEPIVRRGRLETDWSAIRAGGGRSSTLASHGVEPIVEAIRSRSGQRPRGRASTSPRSRSVRATARAIGTEHQAAGPGDGDVVLQWAQHVDVSRGELGVADDGRRLEGGAQQRRPVPVVGQGAVEGPQVGADIVEPSAAGEGPRPPPVRRRRVRRRPQVVERVQGVVRAALLGGDLHRSGRSRSRRRRRAGTGAWRRGPRRSGPPPRRTGLGRRAPTMPRRGRTSTRRASAADRRSSAARARWRSATLAVADLVGGDEPGQVGQRPEAGREPARLGKDEEPVAGGRPDRLARWAPGGPAQPQEHSRLDERIGDLIGHRGGLRGRRATSRRDRWRRARSTSAAVSSTLAELGPAGTASSVRPRRAMVPSSTSDQSRLDHRSSALTWRIAATTPSTSPRASASTAAATRARRAAMASPAAAWAVPSAVSSVWRRVRSAGAHDREGVEGAA